MPNFTEITVQRVKVGYHIAPTSVVFKVLQAEEIRVRVNEVTGTLAVVQVIDGLESPLALFRDWVSVFYGSEETDSPG